MSKKPGDLTGKEAVDVLRGVNVRLDGTLTHEEVDAFGMAFEALEKFQRPYDWFELPGVK